MAERVLRTTRLHARASTMRRRRRVRNRVLAFLLFSSAICCLERRIYIGSSRVTAIAKFVISTVEVTVLCPFLRELKFVAISDVGRAPTGPRACCLSRYARTSRSSGGGRIACRWLSDRYDALARPFLIPGRCRNRQHCKDTHTNRYNNCTHLNPNS